MALVCPIRPVSWDGFEEHFRLAMGREMTPQERKWLRLSDLVLDMAADEEEDEDEDKLRVG